MRILETVDVECLGVPHIFKIILEFEMVSFKNEDCVV